MQAITATLRAGGSGSVPLSKDAAYECAFCTSSSVADMAPPDRCRACGYKSDNIDNISAESSVLISGPRQRGLSAPGGSRRRARERRDDRERDAVADGADRLRLPCAGRRRAHAEPARAAG